VIFHSPYPPVAIPAMPFSEFIFANVAHWRDQPAFVDGPTGRTLTHGQMYRAARNVGAALQQRRMRKGDVFAIVCPNVPEYGIAFHGAAIAGGVVTTANPLATVEELASQFKDSQARFALTTETLVAKVREAAAGTYVEELFVLGESEDATPFAGLMDTDAAAPVVQIDPRADLLMLPYSSGTTGRPKGVMLTHYNAVAMLTQIESLAPDVTGRISLAALPFFHSYGLQILLNGTLRRGTTCVTMPRFDFAQFLQLIQDRRVTSLALVPPIVLALAKHPLVDEFDLSSLSLVGSGAAPLGAALQADASKRLKVSVRQGYGMTEVVVAVTGLPLEDAVIKPGSVGPLLPNVEARIVDVASGTDLGHDERGELLVRGPNVMRGYLNRPAESQAMIQSDGWMHTGDVGYFDSDGHLYIVDRLKELIKYKGYQIAPAHLEGILLEHPAISDAAVIGVAKDEAGEIPKAFVVLRGSATAEEIIAYVATRVAPHAKIRAVEFVDAIPKSPSGKILRRELRERSNS